MVYGTGYRDYEVNAERLNSETAAANGYMRETVTLCSEKDGRRSKIAIIRGFAWGDPNNPKCGDIARMLFNLGFFDDKNEAWDFVIGLKPDSSWIL